MGPNYIASWGGADLTETAKQAIAAHGNVYKGTTFPHYEVSFFQNVSKDTFHIDNGDLLRHYALVFDADTDEVRAYMDGDQLGAPVKHDGFPIKDLDCEYTNETYIGFMHRAPNGAYPMVGDIADLRMYVGKALSDEDMHKIAFESQTSYQECGMPNQDSDTTFTDSHGHPCAWYQSAKQKLPDAADICVAPDVRTQCPVACQSKKPCYEKDPSDSIARELWQRILLLKHEESSNQGTSGGAGAPVICGAQGVNLIRKCKTGWTAAQQKQFNK